MLICAGFPGRYSLTMTSELAAGGARTHAQILEGHEIVEQGAMQSKLLLSWEIGSPSQIKRRDAPSGKAQRKIMQSAGMTDLKLLSALCCMSHQGGLLKCPKLEAPTSKSPRSSASTKNRRHLGYTQYWRSRRPSCSP